MITMGETSAPPSTPQIRTQEPGRGAKGAIRKLALGMADTLVELGKKSGLDRGSQSTHCRAIRQVRFLPMQKHNSTTDRNPFEWREGKTWPIFC
jgi:hypothetical protein